jgi:hypothetical protein
MAIIQAVLAYLSRSVGRIFMALFDWAVVALFGQVDGTRKTVLTILMAAAAAWPLLLAGVVAPKTAAFVLAFVPLPRWVSSEVVRVVWIVLALLVPVGVGVAIGMLGRGGDRRPSVVRSVLLGFPVTVGLAAAFLVLLVTVPVLRVVSAIRRHRDVYVSLVTRPDSYGRAADRVAETLRRHGIRVAAMPPPWWMSVPSQILLRLGRAAFTGYVLEETAYFRSKDLEAAFYPNALLLRGSEAETGRAQALVVEALTGEPDVFQTVSSEAQAIEQRVQRLWTAAQGYRQDDGHPHARPLPAEVESLGKELAEQPLPFDEWQVVYREICQLERALGGMPQIMELALASEGPHPRRASDATAADARRMRPAAVPTGVEAVLGALVLAAGVVVGVASRLRSRRALPG